MPGLETIESLKRVDFPPDVVYGVAIGGSSQAGKGEFHKAVKAALNTLFPTELVYDFENSFGFRGAARETLDRLKIGDDVEVDPEEAAKIIAKEKDYILSDPDKLLDLYTNPRKRLRTASVNRIVPFIGLDNDLTREINVASTRHMGKVIHDDGYRKRAKLFKKPRFVTVDGRDIIGEGTDKFNSYLVDIDTLSTHIVYCDEEEIVDRVPGTGPREVRIANLKRRNYLDDTRKVYPSSMPHRFQHHIAIRESIKNQDVEALIDAGVRNAAAPNTHPTSLDTEGLEIEEISSQVIYVVSGALAQCLELRSAAV